MPVTRGQKRRRDAADEAGQGSTPDSHLLHPAKRTAVHQQRHFPYTRLSRLYLTKRALRDYDRHLSRHSCPTPPPPSPPQLLALDKQFPTLEDIGIDPVHHLESGGPDLRDLRGYSDRMAPKSKSKIQNRAGNSRAQSSTQTYSERKSSAYDANFEQILIDHGSFPDTYRHPDNRRIPKPDNWGDINAVLGQQRRSLSPEFSEEDHDVFRQKNNDALSEKKVMSSVFPIITGDADIPSEEDRLFGNLESFADGITDAKPDFFDGSRPAQLDPQVREDLGPFIVPSKQGIVPILPNFFAEGKGPDGSLAVARRQALYDGTLGARAMHRIQSYGRKLTYDNNAYTITSIYHSGVLRLYTSHPSPSTHPERSTDYHMVHLKTYALEDLRSFREGAAALRNVRDWAKEKRDLLIQSANETAKTMPPKVSSGPSKESSLSNATNSAQSRESDTSTDELTEVTTVEKPKRKLSHASQRCSEGRSKLNLRSHGQSSSQKK